MVIAITGANGFIGTALTSALVAKEHTVVALVRTTDFITKAQVVKHFDMEQHINPNLLHGVDILIHCAFIGYPENKNAADLNYNGTAQLMDLARTAGVRKAIFFSTVSAHPGVESVYGKSKMQVENLFKKEGDVIIKCALVLGEHGLFGRILRQALSGRIIPLVNGGKTIMQVIAIEDVVMAVEKIIEHNLSGSLVLANREKITYKALFRKIEATGQKRFYYLPLGKALLLLLIGIASKLRIPIPVSRENIIGLGSLQYLDPEESLRRLNMQPKETLDKLSELYRDMMLRNKAM